MDSFGRLLMLMLVGNGSIDDNTIMFGDERRLSSLQAEKDSAIQQQADIAAAQGFKRYDEATEKATTESMIFDASLAIKEKMLAEASRPIRTILGAIACKLTGLRHNFLFAAAHQIQVHVSHAFSSYPLQLIETRLVNTEYENTNEAKYVHGWLFKCRAERERILSLKHSYEHEPIDICRATQDLSSGNFASEVYYRIYPHTKKIEYVFRAYERLAENDSRTNEPDFYNLTEEALGEADGMGFTNAPPSLHYDNRWLIEEKKRRWHELTLPMNSDDEMVLLNILTNYGANND